MILDFEPQQLILLVLLAITFVLLITEYIRMDLVAVLLVAALAISGILNPEEAFSGFSSEPAIVVTSIFVLTGAIFHTGLSNRLGTLIGRFAGGSYSRMIAVTMPAVALLSAFTHHVTITAIMLPVTLKLSQERNISPSKLLMPMSFAASLGTTITIVGAPAFLIADGILKQAGRSGLGIFSIAPIGLVLSVVGTLFVLTIGRFLLPDRKGSGDDSDSFRLDGYYTELIVLEKSSFIGKTIAEIEAEKENSLIVVGWLRHGQPRNRPFEGKKIMAGDVLIVRTTPEKLASVTHNPGVDLYPITQYGEQMQSVDKKLDNDGSERLIQAVIAPNSDLVGRTIASVNFLQQFGVIVVGIWRRRGWLRTQLSRIKLRGGDILVLRGDEDSFARIKRDRSFLLLLPFQNEPQMHHKGTIAGVIMAATIAAAALNLLSVQVALFAGAVAMVLSRCITVRQAYQSIDTRIFVFIAGAIPIGLAMENTGMSSLTADWLNQLVGDWPPMWILFALFVASALITQFMSDSATTALLAPIALALANTLGQPPEPFVISIAMAAVASFLTPIGHHGNLLIYGPGRYQFSDFVRVGAPLTLLVAIVVVLMAPLLWTG